MARSQSEDPVDRGRLPFPGRVGRRVSLSLGLIFGVVLLVGGLSLLSARSISLRTEKIRQQYQQIEVMDAVHGSVHHFISAMQQAIVARRALAEGQQQGLEADLNERLRQLAELETARGDFPEKEKEDRIFREIRRMMGELLPLSERIAGSLVRGSPPAQGDLSLLAEIEWGVHGQALAMNQIQQVKIRRLIQESGESMRLILTLYLAFVFVGSFLIVMGSVIFSRTIVLPLRRLAAATLEVARGDLTRRVPVTTQDEIGQLSHAFNVMAERLEDHERTVQSLAVVEERERIAREMHDGLAQALGYVLLKVREAARAQRSNREARLPVALEEAEKMAEEAYREVRQSIFGLRTLVSRSLGIVPTLAEYLHEFSEQSGILVDLRIPDEERIRLSPDAEVQLIRIIQEALANVRKHAAASRAWVAFEAREGQVEVAIGDDGRGFDRSEVQARSRACFGLQTMQERAAACGGSLEVESTPGKGTRVLARLPAMADGRVG